MPWRPTLGAWPEPGGINFRVWAPRAKTVEVVIEEGERAARVALLDPSRAGFFAAFVPGVREGDGYRYRIDGQGLFSDPASRFQPEGVHGPSQVVDPGHFPWTDQGWKGVPREDLVVYELHVGSFSPEGTFAGVARKLSTLRELGVTAIELMPVADFPGDCNWGYDGVDMFAPARCYGTPDDLRRLVDLAHKLGLAVLLDVVYNHFGPAGNYTHEFSKQYLSTRQNAWGARVNLDEAGSEHVREFFVENALHWLHEYHIDGLRLDATHELVDESVPHFLAFFSSRIRASIPDRWVPLIAEDHRNLDSMLRPVGAGGWDLDGVWADDFHHQIRRMLAGDDEGYFRDYSGAAGDLAATLSQGWFYTGQTSIHSGEPRGTDPSGIPPRSFVICLQNHDQVGNRPFGDRIHHAIDLASYRAASALLLCVPQTPLLFMGQEWGATAPFLYFTDHDDELGRLITEGRRFEFRHFSAFASEEYRERIPDPQVQSTFDASRLDWSERHREPHASTLRLYQALLKLRHAEPGLRATNRDQFATIALDADTLLLRRDSPAGDHIAVVAQLRGSGSTDLSEILAGAVPEGWVWECLLTTEDRSFAVEPSPPRIERTDSRLVVHFPGPAAVILKLTRTTAGPNA